MSRVDAGYVAYLTRENAWLRARVADLSSRLAEATAALEDLGLEMTVLEARACGRVPDKEVDGT